jgi:hypothetical protein
VIAEVPFSSKYNFMVTVHSFYLLMTLSTAMEGLSCTRLVVEFLTKITFWIDRPAFTFCNS